jgi:glycosyltransferase involved in cell wall biosynthesis
MRNSAPVATIVMPAFNEATRIGQSLDAIGAYAAARALPLELLVVDDGSTDATAATAAWHLPQSAYIHGRVLSYSANRGKGYAVRYGLLAARAPIALFSDADLSTPIAEMDKLIAPIADGELDITIGSRAIDRGLIGVHQPRRRELAGRAFNFVLRQATGLPFHDTQCGFKAFRLDICRPLIEAGTIDGFGFDVELLYEACRAGLRVHEIPVRWDHREGSKVNVLRDGSRMLYDVVTVRSRGAIGAYDRGIQLAGIAARRDRLSRLESVPGSAATA